MQIKRLVEASGGVVLSKPTLDYRDHLIRLLVNLLVVFVTSAHIDFNLGQN